MVKNYIIFGPPGAGKGTLAAKVGQKYGFEPLSTGEIFRKEIKSKSELGLKLEKIVSSGLYVDDAITNQIVYKQLMALNQAGKKAILDGYPRTLEQLKYLQTIFESQSFHIWILEASESLIIERLSGRSTCPLCKSTYHNKNNPSRKGRYCQNDDQLLETRVDDRPEAIKKRLEVYKSQTLVLEKHLPELGKVFYLDSSKQIMQLLADLEELEDFET